MNQTFFSFPRLQRPKDRLFSRPSLLTAQRPLYGRCALWAKRSSANGMDKKRTDWCKWACTLLWVYFPRPSKVFFNSGQSSLAIKYDRFLSLTIAQAYLPNGHLHSWNKIVLSPRETRAPEKVNFLKTLLWKARREFCSALAKQNRKTSPKAVKFCPS